jgi:hypothetical protein
MLAQDRVRRILGLVLVFGSIFSIGVIAFSLPSFGSRLTLSLLPSGVALALTYRLGRRVWPAVFLAGLAIDIWNHQPGWGSLGVGAGLAGGAWLSAWLLERVGFDPGFSRAKDVPLFILGVAAGMILAPTFGLLGFYFSGAKEFARTRVPGFDGGAIPFRVRCSWGPSWWHSGATALTAF